MSTEAWPAPAPAFLPGRSPAALIEFWSGAQKELTAYARSRLSRYNIAESVLEPVDVVQEAFIRFQPGWPEARWPLAYAKFQAKVVVWEAMRHEKTQRESCGTIIALDASLGEEIIEPSPTAEDVLIAQQTAQVQVEAVTKALQALSDRQREAIELVDGQGLTRTEAAEEMSVHPGTVGQHVDRARHSLRGQLAEVWALAEAWTPTAATVFLFVFLFFTFYSRLEPEQQLILCGALMEFSYFALIVWFIRRRF